MFLTNETTAGITPSLPVITRCRKSFTFSLVTSRHENLFPMERCRRINKTLQILTVLVEKVKED